MTRSIIPPASVQGLELTLQTVFEGTAAYGLRREELVAGFVKRKDFPVPANKSMPTLFVDGQRGHEPDDVAVSQILAGLRTRAPARRRTGCQQPPPAWRPTYATLAT